MELKTNIAKHISFFLGPTLIPILYTIVVFNSGLTENQLLIVAPAIFLLLVVTPIAYLFLAPKAGLIKTWEMVKRKERYQFFIILILLTIAGSVIIFYFGNELLLKLNLLFLFTIVVLFAITLFWKISLHVAINTASSLVVNFLFNWSFPLLYLTIPLVAWSRLVLKRHSSLQLLAGFIVTFGIFLTGLKLFF
jgi:membrane-associated phospholipid phosphatase